MHTPFRKTPLSVLGTVLLLGGGMAGCGGVSHGAAVPLTTSASASVSPMIRGALPQRDLDTVNLAQQLVTQACLKQQGFRYALFGTGGTRPVHAADAPYQQSVAQARSRGFGGSDTASHMSGAEPPNDNARYLATLSANDRARFQKALAGGVNDRMDQRLSDGAVWSVPRHGCVAKAYERVYGTLQTYLQYSAFSSNVLRTASSETDTNRKYQAAQRAWVSCIHGKGYRAATPTELAQQALAPYTKRGTVTDAAKQREIAMAVAGAECDVSAHLSASHDRAKQDSIDRLVGLNPAAYRTFQNTAAAALARAKAIVAIDSPRAGG